MGAADRTFPALHEASQILPGRRLPRLHDSIGVDSSDCKIGFWYRSSNLVNASLSPAAAASIKDLSSSPTIGSLSRSTHIYVAINARLHALAERNWTGNPLR